MSSPPRPRPLLAFAFALPAVFLAAYFAALGLSGGLGWPPALLVSSVGLAAVTGLTTAALMHAGLTEG